MADANLSLAEMETLRDSILAELDARPEMYGTAWYATRSEAWLGLRRRIWDRRDAGEE